MNVHFSSATDDWATPQDFFDSLNAIYNFELDVCASETNAKCAKYFTKEINGLMQPWGGGCLDESAIR
jgi:site-specific DNA-methyltransferase (adenine-specific)